MPRTELIADRHDTSERDADQSEWRAYDRDVQRRADADMRAERMSVYRVQLIVDALTLDALATAYR